MILAKAKVQTVRTTIKALVAITTKARVIQVPTTLTMTEARTTITPETTTTRMLESQTLAKTGTLGIPATNLKEITKRALMTKIKTMAHQQDAQQAMFQPHPQFWQVWV